MKQFRLAIVVLLVALATPSASAGPSEINGLTRQLAAIDAEIRATAVGMRDALRNLNDTAGEQGQHLRTLKRERERIRQALQQATKVQKDRDLTAKSMPNRKPGLDLGPAATADAPPGDKRPQVDVAPTGAMVPAPTL